MTIDRDATIKALKPYFSVKELVCPHVYQKWGEKSWQFLDTNLLYCILLLRETIIARPMYVNGKTYTQRGLRCNMCDIVKSKETPYLSAHVLGKAIDFTIGGLTAEQGRQLIKKHAAAFPCNIRIEKDKTWVHFDVLPQYGVKQKVYEFVG